MNKHNAIRNHTADLTVPVRFMAVLSDTHTHIYVYAYICMYIYIYIPTEPSVDLARAKITGR